MNSYEKYQQINGNTEQTKNESEMYLEKAKKELKDGDKVR